MQSTEKIFGSQESASMADQEECAAIFGSQDALATNANTAGIGCQAPMENDAQDLRELCKKLFTAPAPVGKDAHPLVQLVTATGFTGTVQRGDNAAVTGRYADFGLPVFPCGRGVQDDPQGKYPLTTHGFKDATTDKAVLKKWWDKWPHACPGMPTGGPAGLVVVDVDRPKLAEIKDKETGAVRTEWTPDGLDTLNRWVREHGPLPATLVVKTPGKQGPDGRIHHGLHICYLLTEETAELINRTEALPGIDVRATGGYVIAPGATRRDGGKYAPLLISDIAEMPADLCAVLPHRGQPAARKRGGKPTIPLPAPMRPAGGAQLPGPGMDLPAGCQTAIGASGEQYIIGPGHDTVWGVAILDKACDDIEGTPEGARNSTASAKALHVGNLVVGGWLSYQTAYDKLWQSVSSTVGSGEAEARAILRQDTWDKASLAGYGPRPDGAGIAIWRKETGVAVPDSSLERGQKGDKVRGKIAAVLKHSRQVTTEDAALHPLLKKLRELGVTNFNGLFLNEYQGKARIMVKVHGAGEDAPRTLYCVWEDDDHGTSVGGVKIADAYADLSTGDKAGDCDICACADLFDAVVLRQIVGDLFRVVFLPARRTLKDAGATLRTQFPTARICFCSTGGKGDAQRAKAGAAHCDGRHAVLPDCKHSVLTQSGEIKRRSLADMRTDFEDAILEALEEESAPTDKPLITLDPDETTAILDRIGVLLGYTQAVFKRYGLLVQIVDVERKLADTGAVTVRPTIRCLNLHSLRALVVSLARFQKLDVRNDGMKKAIPPDSLLQSFLATPEHWHDIPILSSMIAVPTIRTSGEIIAEYGLHDSSGLFCTCQAGEFREVAETPSKEDALAALTYLRDVVLEGFPFADGPSRAAALAALLTTAVRPMLNHIPMFGFTAPTPGTGKSALCDVVALTCTGRTATTVTVSKSEEELTKALTTYLLAGDPVLLLDNVSKIFNLDKLCSLLTQEEVTDRRLGTHEQVTSYPESIWLISGNNLTIVGDTTRRVIMCSLDAKIERPSQRSFSRELYGWVREHRHQIVHAVLTILRAHIRAGLPGARGMRPLLGFDKWSTVVRGALLWLGEADPLLTQEKIEQVDPVREQRLQLLEAWHDVYGQDTVTSRDLVSLTRESSSLYQDASPEGQAKESLANCLRDLCGHGGVTERALGTKLARLVGVVTGDYSLTKVLRTGRDKVTGWIVAKRKASSVAEQIGPLYYATERELPYEDYDN